MKFGLAQEFSKAINFDRNVKIVIIDNWRDSSYGPLRFSEFRTKITCMCCIEPSASVGFYSAKHHLPCPIVLFSFKDLISSLISRSSFITPASSVLILLFTEKDKKKPMWFIWATIILK